MIKIYDLFDKVNDLLAELSADAVIDDYRLVLNNSMSVSAYVKCSACNREKVDEKLCAQGDVSIHYVDDEEDDEYYTDLFKMENKYDTRYSRRNLNALLQPIDKVDVGVPVVTFYSYKGGVGRSTALVAFASYMSICHKKKVVVLDCDFEAPGFSNFFMEDPEHPAQSNGILEYLIDADFEEEPTLTNYCREVSKLFSGDGQIYVFPAGNLDDCQEVGKVFPTNMSHYVNGIARLDLGGRNGFVKQLENLLKQIKEQLAPDVVLIDSRTGFNDVYGVAACRMSNVVVGFFGDNAQSLPGLHFFLDMEKQPRCPRLVAVNSIVPQSNWRKRLEHFSETVNSYLQKISEELDNELSVDVYVNTENDILRNVGMSQADYRDFVDLVSGKALSDYTMLFNDLYEFIDLDDQNIEVAQVRKAEPANDDDKDPLALKKKILTNLRSRMPELYAENIEDFSAEYKENRYFFRKCMLDLFNITKMLVLGNKGTGKSYIYKSLKNKDIVNELKHRAGKDDIEFKFVHVIDKGRRFDTVGLDGSIPDEKAELYYERFWLLYVWSAVVADGPFDYTTELQRFKFDDGTKTVKRIMSIVKDEDAIVAVEEDMQKFDAYLSQKGGSQVIVIFDELDNIVKPHKWAQRIAPLVNLCKKMQYKSIFPKLFLRSDLYQKLYGINNKEELGNRAVDIEWKRAELFTYFFKLVLSHSKEELKKYMRAGDAYPRKFVNETLQAIDANINGAELNEGNLKHLCNMFFGQYAGTDNTPRFGESYDWFFKNLKNANETISLRPFIDLITLAVDKEMADNDQRPSPVLPQCYYNNKNVRGSAVKNHLNDLASETGNTDLVPILEYIRVKASYELKKDKLPQQTFYNLIDRILNTEKLHDCKDRDAVIQLLEINGIVRLNHRNGHLGRCYEFAYLYKYYLGLKG